MMKSVIKKVSVKHGEAFKGRVLEVKCKKDKSFKTPSKIPSTTEILGKKHLKIKHEWDNKIYEISQGYYLTKVNNLDKNAKNFKVKLNSIRSLEKNIPENVLTMYHAQFDEYTRLSDKTVETLIDLQLEAGFDIIQLPETYNCSVDDFERNFEKYFDYINITRPDAVLMPQIRLRQKSSLFEEKLKILGEFEGYLKAINIRYSMFMHLKRNVESLAKFSDKDFWIHTSNCTRLEMNRLIPTSTQHILQKYGMDTFSSEIPMYRQGLTNRVAYEILYYNPQTLIVSEINECMDNGYLRCNCPICRRHKFEYLCEDLEKKNNQSLITNLNDFSKIHELYTSTAEFEKSQMYIEEERLMDYFKLKVGLRKFID